MKAVELTSGGLRRVPETGLREPRGSLTPAQKSAEGIVGRAVGEAIEAPTPKGGETESAEPGTTDEGLNDREGPVGLATHG